MSNLGELELNLTIKIVRARTFPAHPECGIPRPYTAVEKIEIYDGDGFLIESDELKTYVFNTLGEQLEKVAKEALAEMETESRSVGADFYDDIRR